MKIDPLVYSARFPAHCDLKACGSRCCRYGVWADVEEKRLILENRELFLPWVRPLAADPETWFGRSEPDPDCPSGHAVETQEVDGGCAFLHPGHGCALQKAAVENGYPEWHFKPRFCIMFPLVVTEGVLTVDEDMKSIWCMQPENRTRPILAAVEREVRHLFDADTADRLLKGGKGKTARP